MSLLKFKVKAISTRELNNGLIILFFSLAGIFSIEFSSLITFVLFLLLSILFGRIFFKEIEDYRIILLFCFYTVLAILIYWFQYIQFPQNHGATGEGIFGGTDDLFFFQEATQKGMSYRGDRSMEMHPYAIFLEFFNNVITIYKVPKLLDLLFVNIFAFTFIPIFTKKVAEKLMYSEQGIKLTFYFTALCPIMIINGLVLVRDGWTAMLLIASIFFMIDRRFVLTLMTVLLSFYLRVSSGAITLFFLSVILMYSGKNDIPEYRPRKKQIYLLILLIAIVVSIPSILFFMKINGISNSFFREGLLSFIDSTGSTKSAADFIYNLPPLFRVFIGPFFYFGSPFLSLNDIVYNNAITIRSLIVQVFPLLFVFYFSLFIQFVGLLINMNKRKIISLLFFAFIFSIFILSQLSLQPRHKTMIMPVFYLLVGYGYQNRNSNSLFVALLISSILFFLEIIYNLI